MCDNDREGDNYNIEVGEKTPQLGFSHINIYAQI
jgi:hypothetical protein